MKKFEVAFPQTTSKNDHSQRPTSFFDASTSFIALTNISHFSHWLGSLAQ
jgi:hypothetical protein